MKRHCNLAIVGGLIVAIAVLGCQGKNSKLASPALKLAKKFYELEKEHTAKLAEHRSSVAAEIKFSKSSSKTGKLTLGFTARYDSEGNKVDKEFKFGKEKVCYVKYTRGEEWGVLTTYDCDDKKQAKAIIKKWEKKLDRIQKKKSKDVEPEHEYFKDFDRKFASMLAGNPDFDVNVCIEDANSVMVDLRKDYLKNRCEKAPDQNTLLREMLRAANAKRFVDEEFNVDKEAVAAKDEDNASDIKKAINKYVKWIKGLESDDDKKKALALVKGGDQTCMDWWYFDNGSAQKEYGYKEAASLCLTAVMGGGKKPSARSYGDLKKRDKYKRRYGSGSGAYKRDRPTPAVKRAEPAPARVSPPPSSSGSSGSSSGSSSGESTGIPECDDYLNKWETCIKTGYPASVRATLLKTVTKLRATYKKYGAMASVKATMASSCTRAKANMAKSTKRYGCKW